MRRRVSVHLRCNVHSSSRPLEQSSGAELDTIPLSQFYPLLGKHGFENDDVTDAMHHFFAVTFASVSACRQSLKERAHCDLRTFNNVHVLICKAKCIGSCMCLSPSLCNPHKIAEQQHLQRSRAKRQRGLAQSYARTPQDIADGEDRVASDLPLFGSQTNLMCQGMRLRCLSGRLQVLMETSQGCCRKADLAA